MDHDLVGRARCRRFQSSGYLAAHTMMSESNEDEFIWPEIEDMRLGLWCMGVVTWDRPGNSREGSFLSQILDII